MLKTSWYHIDGLGYFDSKRVVFISDPVETEYTYSYRVLIEGADPFYCTTARPEDIPAAKKGYEMLVKLVCEEAPLVEDTGLTQEQLDYMLETAKRVAERGNVCGILGSDYGA